jgi:CubicO group peptidase (beta-lactamase class C family)
MFLVMKHGIIEYEDYARSVSPKQPLKIYSGTKSFSCAIATVAAQEGLLDLDESVAKTIDEWRDDPVKSRITIRQLLSLTSGLGENKWQLLIPTYNRAVEANLKAKPGTAFKYGPTPFQVFGELMRRKLMPSKLSPLDYLQRKVFRPIGLIVGKWRKGRDGNPLMPAGAFLTAREWAKYGELILNQGHWRGETILAEARLAECFKGSAANPGYGLSFWLPGKANGRGEHGAVTRENTKKLLEVGAGEDITKAVGRGGQKLYIIPSEGLVIVHQADRWGLWRMGFKDADFLKPILKHYARSAEWKPTIEP